MEEFIAAMTPARHRWVGLPQLVAARRPGGSFDRGHGHGFGLGPDHERSGPCWDNGIAADLAERKVREIPQFQPVILVASRERVRTQATKIATNSEPCPTTSTTTIQYTPAMAAAARKAN